MNGASRWLVWLVALWISAGGLLRTARAQAISGEVRQVGLEGAGLRGGAMSWYRPGAWVPVRVHLENHTTTRFAGYLAVEQLDLDGDKVRCISREMVLEPGLEGRDVWLYYWPRPDSEDRRLGSIAILDEKKSLIGTLPVKPEAAGRPVTDHDQDQLGNRRWVVVLGPDDAGFGAYHQVYGGVASNVISTISGVQGFPDSPLGLDGVDVVVWEANANAFGVQELGDVRTQALMNWVRAGGHLIISVGDKWQELADPKYGVSQALPMVPERTRELSDARIVGEYLGMDLPRGPRALLQAAGQAKPTSTVLGRGGALDADSPLVVTGTYGAGVITLVTVDLTAPAFHGVNGMEPQHWLRFWQITGGWSGSLIGGDVVTRDQFNKWIEGKSPPDPVLVMLDQGVSASVDLAKQTALRLALAVLFLGGYWVIAGPGGFLVLRRYKMMHWSWWIFGATVLAASAAAVLVVWTFKLESYELRHRTFVAGRVGSNEVAVVGYYGIFAPLSGRLEVALPESPGLAYVAPLCEPSSEPVKSYADPQGYDLNNVEAAKDGETATRALVPFRSTLKKMQARWTGPMEAMISGEGLSATRMTPRGERRLRMAPTGKLRNQTPYELQDVMVVVLSPDRRQFTSDTLLRFEGVWKPGTQLDLATLTAEKESLGECLRAAGMAQSSSLMGGGMGHGRGMGKMEDEPPVIDLNAERAANLLNVLLELRGGDGVLDTSERREFERQLTRLMDRSAAARAGRLLVLARAGDTREKGVQSPLAIQVNGRPVAGGGEVLFTWVADLPVPENAK